MDDYIFKLIEDLVKKQPKLFNKTHLATDLCLKYPDLFKDTEKTRRKIRQVCDKLNNKSKETFKNSIIGKDVSTIGILGDVHAPYEDKKAVSIALNYLAEIGIDELILNGDISDFYKISFWKSDPERMSFNAELKYVKKWLAGVREKFSDIPITYVMGNHEVRLERFLQDKCPELVGIEGFDVPSVLGLGKLDIEFVDNVKLLCQNLPPLRRGKLKILHGHELRIPFSAVNVPRIMMMKTMSNVIFGHIHRTQQHISKNLDSAVIGCWSVGTLGKLREHFMPVNEWNHGFAVVKVDNKTGNFSMSNKMIINGEIL